MYHAFYMINKETSTLWVISLMKLWTEEESDVMNSGSLKVMCSSNKASSDIFFHWQKERILE